jgi:hypothetical protein
MRGTDPATLAEQMLLISPQCTATPRIDWSSLSIHAGQSRADISRSWIA